MLVLGDVGEMREIAEGADDADGLVVRQAADDGLELLARGLVRVAVEAQRGLADALDEGEGLIAFLGVHRLAEDTAEEPYVVAQRRVLVGRRNRLVHRF